MPSAASVKERLGFLDVARALAALLVLAEHGLNTCLPHYLPSFLPSATLGRAGVILFLLISGFIIPASLEHGGSNARFWLRRFFRLFPAYWLSLAVAFGYCWRSGQFVSAMPSVKTGDWLLNLTMLQGFFARPHVWGVFWTLQLELVIYVTCSLLFTAGLLRRSSWIAWLAVAGYALMGLGRPLLEGKPFGFNGQRFLYFAPLAGLMAQRYFAGRFGGRSLLAWGLAQVGILAAVWSVNHALFPAEMTTACLWEWACTWGVACACFFLLLAARDRPMPSAGRWMGRISYSVYLLHPFVLMVLSPAHGPAWAFLLGLLAGTLLLAELAYRFVELPGIALGRAVERRWLPSTTQPSSGAPPSRRAA
jgi:peptidoglycan/LPS O-acetylase OafA/YrhL